MTAFLVNNLHQQYLVTAGIQLRNSSSDFLRVHLSVTWHARVITQQTEAHSVLGCTTILAPFQKLLIVLVRRRTSCVFEPCDLLVL